MLTRYFYLHFASIPKMAFVRGSLASAVLSAGSVMKAVIRDRPVAVKGRVGEHGLL